MKRFSFLFALAALGLLTILVAGCGAPASAGSPPTASANTNTAALVAGLQTSVETLPATITVNGAGLASAPPDLAYVTLGVATVNADPARAIGENDTKMTVVMETLKALGIDPADIQTVNYMIWIEQVVDTDGVPTGESRYHVSNQVRVKVIDLSKTGKVLQMTLAAGANTVDSVEFAVADSTALHQQARDLAMSNAQAMARQLATGFGVKLGAVRDVIEFSGIVQPLALTTDMDAGGSVPISGGSFSVSVDLQVVYDIAE